MSYYTNFLEELPRRNLELLNRYFKKEKKEIEPYEVTLLISLAMPVFVITNEIINKGGGNIKNDKDLKKILHGNIHDNSIFVNINNNWLHKTCIDIDNESMEGFKVMIEIANLKPISILSQLRNALSHGGIKFIKGFNGQISSILFISEKRAKDGSVSYYYNQISIDGFRIFLENWCKFLKKWNINEIFNAEEDTTKPNKDAA